MNGENQKGDGMSDPATAGVREIHSVEEVEQRPWGGSGKRIAMLTTFHGYLDSYSLCRIAKMQLKMLHKNGYQCRFLFRGGDSEEWAKWTDDIRRIPDFIVDNDGSTKDMEKRSGKKPEEMIMETLAALEKELKDVEVVITQDLIFQPSNFVQDQAAALFAEKHPEVLWLHWIHSATSPRDLGKRANTRYPNGYVVYPNSWDVPRVAKNFGVEEALVKVVPHATDFEDFFKLHPLTVQMIEEKGLLDAEVVGCYPLRLDRGKQPEFAIRIFSQIKRQMRRSIRFVIADFQSTGGDKVKFREELKELIVDLGMNANECFFMSEFDQSCHLETPYEVIRDLMLLSNVYIHPSRSETYSLTVQEARICKNLLVLNFDFPAMRSIYGDAALYRKFGAAVNPVEGTDGNINVSYGEGVDRWCGDAAANIVFWLDNQPVLRGATETRMNKNIYSVFKRFYEPLFHGSTALRFAPRQV